LGGNAADPLAYSNPWLKLGICCAALVLIFAIRVLGFAYFSQFNVLCIAFSVISVVLAVASLLFLPADAAVGFTRVSVDSFADNLSPRFSADSGSGSATDGFRSVANLILPLGFGFWAGALTSSDLATPSRSIPAGTMAAISSGFSLYVGLAVLLAATFTRSTLQTNFFVLTDVCLIRPLMSASILFAGLSSALASFCGASEMMQTLTDDDLLPPLRIFRRKHAVQAGRSSSPNVKCVLATAAFVLGLLVLRTDLEVLAPYSTLSFAMTFCFINVACLLLRLSDAPNFRPTFKQFSAASAFAGGLLSLSTMCMLDVAKSGYCVLLLCFVVLYVHLQNPIKPWGHLTRAVIYSQVRKYLLRLDTRTETLKFWRPSILLLTANPRTSLNLMVFSHMLTRGGLHLIGLVIPGEARVRMHEYRQYQQCFVALLAQLKLEAFDCVTITPRAVTGMLDLLMSAGLGNLKPNTVCIGFWERAALPETAHRFVGRHLGEYPSAVDAFPPARTEASGLTSHEYVGFVRDALALQRNVLIARNFDKLDETVRERAAQVSHTRTPRTHAKAPDTPNRVPLCLNRKESLSHAHSVAGGELRSAAQLSGHRTTCNAQATATVELRLQRARAARIAGLVQAAARARRVVACWSATCSIARCTAAMTGRIVGCSSECTHGSARKALWSMPCR
jgi:amino acid transporter